MTNLNEIAEALTSLNQHVGVISTVSEDKRPESAVVYFTFDKDLNVFFLTRMGSRKYKNISRDADVAFVTHSGYPIQTFQLKGKASDITDPKEQEKVFTELFTLAKQQSFGEPPIEQMMNSELAVMKIIPTWARFGNYDVSEDHTTFKEITFE